MRRARAARRRSPHASWLAPRPCRRDAPLALARAPHVATRVSIGACSGGRRGVVPPLIARICAARVIARAFAARSVVRVPPPRPLRRVFIFSGASTALSPAMRRAWARESTIDVACGRRARASPMSSFRRPESIDPTQGGRSRALARLVGRSRPCFCRSRTSTVHTFMARASIGHTFAGTFAFRCMPSQCAHRSVTRSRRRNSFVVEFVVDFVLTGTGVLSVDEWRSAHGCSRVRDV
jgi:hypothetical protein